MDKSFKLQQVILSALLHDIGVFVQRATQNSLTIIKKHRFEANDSGDPSLYTKDFIEHQLPMPQFCLDSKQDIATIASAYHNPDPNSLEQMCIYISNQLSAGADEIEEDVFENPCNAAKRRLTPIFEEVELLRHKFNSPGNYHYKLNPLTNESIFPEKNIPEGRVEEYLKLFEQFINELSNINISKHFHFYLESLISIFEKYLWSIPSSTNRAVSDISLFDHSFTTAGIAQSLFIYHQHAENSASVPQWDDDAKKFILVAGDLSGIQDYIFGSSKGSGKGNSKILRARSFYLQAIVRAFIIELQRLTGTYSVSRLVDSGGKFVLLLPNTKPLIKTMESLNKEQQKWFRSQFKGLLTLSLTWDTQLTQQDFEAFKLKDKLDEASYFLEVAKLNKLKTTFQSGLIIGDNYNEAEQSNCQLCDINSYSKKATDKLKEQSGEEIRACKQCADQVFYIGRKLPKAKYLIFGDNLNNKKSITLFSKMQMRFAENLPDKWETAFHVESFADDIRFKKARIGKHVPVINSEELKDKLWFDIFSKHEDIDLIDGSIKTFGLIAEKSKKRRIEKKIDQETGQKTENIELIGRPLLGFLKADVDNLGMIFSMGLGDQISISRIATLSRFLEIFFSDYLTSLIETDYPDIYVVFSGGDDLFLIGPWNKIIEFAIVLRKKLSAYCANNQDITMSCAILPAKPRMPARNASDAVEECLDAAKKYEKEELRSSQTDYHLNRIKDSVSFLGEVLAWDELESLISLGKKFDKAVEEKEKTGFSSAFLYRMLKYHNMYKNFMKDKNKNIKSGIYLSHAYYDIARNIKKESDMLCKIFAVSIDENSELAKLNIPLFYAINLNRKDKNRSNHEVQK